MNEPQTGIVFSKTSSTNPIVTGMNPQALFDLSGKTALVTGCSRGIDHAMAVGLAEAGADIIGVSATLEPEGSDIERAVMALGRSFSGYRCDFSNRRAVGEFAARVLDDHGAPDILVNNAGMIRREPAAPIRTHCGMK